MVGLFCLAIEGVGYYVNHTIALKYFPNQDWNSISISDALFALSALYLILVATSGRWKLWADS